MSPFFPMSPFASLFPSSPSPAIRNSGCEKGPGTQSTVCLRWPWAELDALCIKLSDL